MILKALLVDDEQPNLQNLQALLGRYCPQVQVCGAVRDAEAARLLIGSQQPDLLFLDIQMPGENGFDLLRSLPGFSFEVVFVTAHDQYAIRAMRFSAVDYLLKPVSIPELQAAVTRAGNQHRLKQGSRQVENLLQLLKGHAAREEQRIALSGLKETRFVKTGEIVRCESSNNYTTFHLAGGEEILVSRPIYEYEQLLTDFGFIRCHQSHLVNSSFVKSWKKGEGDQLLLSDGRVIPVSRNRKDEVRARLRAI